MKKNVMAKNLRQSILKSITRYIAIVAIIALGAGIFVGLRTTKSDMVQTGQEYMDAQNMFDLRLLNTYGWTEENVEAIAAMDGVTDAEGVISLDVLAHWGDSTSEKVYKVYAMPERITVPYLLGGRMPENAYECVVDGAHCDDSILGTTFVLSEKNEDDTLESLRYQTYTVVGYVSSPLYMDMSRGTTTLGNGTVSGYVYIPAEAFDVDYYTEIGVTIEGDYAIYTEEYNDAMDAMADKLKPQLEPLAQQRYESVLQEAEGSYADGLKEYQDGLEEYREGKEEALSQLADAEQQLLDGQAQIDENRALLEDGLVQIEEGQALIDENALTIISSREQLASARAAAYAQIADANNQLMENYKTVTNSLKLVEDGITQIEDAQGQLLLGIMAMELSVSQIEVSVGLTETMLSVIEVSLYTAQNGLEQAKANGSLDEDAIAKLEAEIVKLEEQKTTYEDQYDELVKNQETASAQLAELYATRESLKTQLEELRQTQQTLQDALATIDLGFMELENSQASMENEFASAEAQIQSGELQLEMAQRELDAQKEAMEAGLIALDEAQAEIDAGWEEYRLGRDEALRQLGEAELQLLEGQVELTQARELIDSFTDPAIYVLGRNTNVSYLSLDSNSDIVEGVSAVFPAFFLLIAALVCITTMTRMVEEERTQIGTLKALGYSNFAIIGKYLAYAGSAAILGCGMGVLLGSWIFPMILWQAYNIILNIRPNITLLIDWPLCLGVVGMYTAVTLGVTWYCCRMALREVPAELIRPKPPTSGKKIFLEYLPFWDKISFLNKVMLRNIFRYRQRLLMMLVGIGGCTALLLTGFGIRDSIVDIVYFQFEEVTLYDMEARFAEGLDDSEQAQFREEIGRYVDRIMFAHQSSVELDFDGQTRDITMIAAGSEFESFMDFHRDTTPIEMPGEGEALLSIGMAERLGISVGDTVTVRDSDLQSLTLTISGIYDNNVYNYIIVTPQTIEAQWGSTPEQQMAYLTVKDTQDANYASTKVSAFDGVMSVTVCEALAEQVNSMLDAMNLVVVTVVICAGILAVTVLYNLTNINITERIREIATIKVLGFNAGESAAYVFKENLLLSAMGSAVGLVFGRLLLEFVMSQIKVDMVWMQARLLPASFVWAIALTMLSAVVVDFVLYFKLDKINMAEALKSVE